MNFYEKIQQIEKLLGNGRFKDKRLLACAIYFKLKMQVSFRKIPLFGIPFSWYNLRYWFQKLEKSGQLQQLENIVGSD